MGVDATGKYVFVANYGDGTVSVLPVGAGGTLGAPLSTLTVGAEAHMIVPDPSNRFVFVPCKGADYVAQFVFDDATGALTPNVTPHVVTAAGAGPRHLAFHPNGKLAVGRSIPARLRARPHGHASLRRERDVERRGPVSVRSGARNADRRGDVVAMTMASVVDVVRLPAIATH